ncbi:RHS repeat-associated core domain-containing protein [Streptomyces sp. NPDC005900]|uniref:RHS repeat-associated core domain-containing protein n=1 Tax=Streptomyces sp. NPDC005900 TaxID=3154569 RepID=UPI0033D26486
MAGNRPRDWHVLDLEKDPTPGDPHRVRKLAKDLHDFSDDVGRVLRDIKGMAGEDAILTWAGKTAEAFTEKFEKAPEKLKKLKKSYGMAGDALAAYWPQLERAQALADKALVKGREAQADLSSATSRLTSADSWMDKAGKEADKYKDDKRAGKDVPQPDPDKVKAATRNAASAEKAQKSAQGDVDAAKSALEAAKKMAADARKMREEAAGAAKRKIDEASDAGIRNRKWWEEIGDWVSDNWDSIVAVCKVVVAVVGIIAMIVGGPILAAIVIIAGAIVLADTLNKYRKGQAGLMDVAFAAMDCVPGMKGITTAAKLAKGMKGLKAMGKGLKNGLRRGADDLATSKPVKGRCKNGDPVDMVSGEMLMEKTDVDLPGLLPLILRRTHLSTYFSGRSFGPSWASTLDERLELDHEGALFAAEDGMILSYPVPAPGSSVLPVQGPRLPLDWDGTPGAPLRITDPTTGHTRHFSPTRHAAAADQAFTMPLAAITDRNGHRIDIDRTPDGTPTAVRHSGGYHLHVDTDASHRVTALRLRDPEAGPHGTTLLRYAYDTDGNLSEIHNSSGLPYELTYDERARITSWTDRNGSWYRFAYDDEDRCVRGEGADGFLSCTVSYDTDNHITLYTDSLGHTTRYEYNERRQLVAETDPLGNTTRTEWNSRDQLLSRTDPLGHTIRYVYDDAGNPVSVTRPDGNTTTAVFNDLLQAVTITDQDGLEWSHTYDARGNRLKTVDPEGAETHFAYDEAGRPISVTDPLGRVQRAVCNPAGLTLEITDPLGLRTQVGRDAFGRIRTVTDPAGSLTRLTWTVEGFLAQREVASGEVEYWERDGEGNVLRHIDPAGHVTHHTYTHFALPTGRQDPDGTPHAFAYDTELQLTSVTNPQQRDWTYAFDAAGRLVAETDFNGRCLTYAHDASGRLASRTNGAGETVCYERDVFGRTTLARTDVSTTSYAYDAYGRLIRAVNQDADIKLAYDRQGQVVRESVNGMATSSTYDLVGRRTTRTTPSGTVSEWKYDAGDRPTSLVMAGTRVEFRHDAAGYETGRQYGDTVSIIQSWDAIGRLADQTLSSCTEATDRVLRRRSYLYRPDGNLAEIVGTAAATRHFNLDAVGRVTELQGPDWTEHYAYDEAGNVSHSRMTGAVGEDSEGTGAPSATGAGSWEVTGTLVHRSGRVHHQHDDQGRLVRRSRRLLNGRRQVWTYGWDAEDRLTSVTTPDGATWHYVYDPLGRRISKQLVGEDGTVTRCIAFIWDGSLLVEQAAADGTVTTWDYEPDSHRPLAQVDRTQDDYDVRFHAIVTDLVGTPTELVTTGGDIAWQALTTLWGSDLRPMPTISHARNAECGQSNAPELASAVDCPLRFPGQYHDPESGLHYNYARHYDPEAARYVSADPLGLEPAPNHHAYVPNPLTWQDPLGLARRGPKDPINLSEGYRGRMDTFDIGHATDFEMHVYDKNGREVGLYGSNGWFDKHRLNSDVQVPRSVENRLKGEAVKFMRKTGRIGPRGTEDLSGDKWKRPRLKGSCG